MPGDLTVPSIPQASGGVGRTRMLALFFRPVIEAYPSVGGVEPVISVLCRLLDLMSVQSNHFSVNR